VKYAWIKQHKAEFADLKIALQTEFEKSRASYGTRRLKAALLGRDRQVSRWRIGRLMRRRLTCRFCLIKASLRRRVP
jgi:hypothetical protein